MSEENKTSEIGLGSLYDMNKAAMINLNPISKTDLKDSLRKIKQFFIDKKDTYFMLLCRERYDFTIFNIKDKNDLSLKEATSALKECFINRGDIISIEPTTDKTAYEIWVRIKEEGMFVFYLFPYDLGIIEC